MLLVSTRTGSQRPFLVSATKRNLVRKKSPAKQTLYPVGKHGSLPTIKLGYGPITLPADKGKQEVRGILPLSIFVAVTYKYFDAGVGLFGLTPS